MCLKLFAYCTIITILHNATISNPSILQNGIVMSFYISLAVLCVGVLVLRHILRKKAYELKQKLYNEINATQTPFTAHELGDKFNAGDGMVYSLLDELVEEKRIAITVTQKVIAGRRVRIRHYHSMIGSFIHA